MQITYADMICWDRDRYSNGEDEILYSIPVPVPQYRKQDLVELRQSTPVKRVHDSDIKVEDLDTGYEHSVHDYKVSPFSRFCPRTAAEEQDIVSLQLS